MIEQDDYKLYTGLTVNFDDADWERMVAIASGRLASFLCLDELPDPLPDDLASLLANFMAVVMAHQGADTQIEEKRIRNFTIRFTNNSAANAFAKIGETYGDIIDKYSNCTSSLHVERDERNCCDGHLYGAPICDCD